MEWYTRAIGEGASSLKRWPNGLSGAYMIGEKSGSLPLPHPEVPRLTPLMIMTSPLGRRTASLMTRGIGMASVIHTGFLLLMLILWQSFKAGS